MSSTKEKIEQVTENIFATILDLEVRSEPGAIESSAGQRYITASVQITGTWDGVVTLNVPASFAQQAAAIMFEVAPDEATDEDIEDAMGELANMTGGSFKSMLEGTCELGLPVVTDGVDYVVRFPGSKTECEVGFRTGDDPFHVTVLVREDDPR